MWLAVAALMPIAIERFLNRPRMFNTGYLSMTWQRKKDLPNGITFRSARNNLIGDDIGDMVSVWWGAAGTNNVKISGYGDHPFFSVWVLIVIHCGDGLSCFTPLNNAIYSIPAAVIADRKFICSVRCRTGVAIIDEHKVDMFSAKNFAVIATIMLCGLGVQYAYGGTTVLRLVSPALRARQISEFC
jgi:uracil permease